MPDSAPIRVLLAEDDPETRDLYASLLTAHGHQVVADVGSGRDAVARARELTPDVVVLDIHMPEATGVEAARQIATALPATAVILVTGDQTVSLSDQDVLETHAVTLLPKPTPPSLLDGALRLAAARGRALAQARHEAADARQALEDRKVIERAKGILMHRAGISEQEAYRMLQRRSQDRSTPMVEIARAVISSDPSAPALK
jgi:response regulator NasT